MLGLANVSLLPMGGGRRQSSAPRTRVEARIVRLEQMSGHDKSGIGRQTELGGRLG